MYWNHIFLYINGFNDFHHRSHIFVLEVNVSEFKLIFNLSEFFVV